MDYDEHLTDLEQDALELIRNKGDILQSQLWRELDCSAGKGSNIANKLEDMDLIKRERTVSNGSSTYNLIIKRKPSEDLDFSLLISGDLLPPFVGDNDVDIHDDRFTQWVMSLRREYQD